MKKIFTLIIAGATGFYANAQYFSDDFEGGSLTANNAWTTQVVADPDVTGADWVLGTVGGNYAKCSNYVSTANHILDTWFISPAIDLSAATSPNLSFDMTKRYAGDDIVVQISTDYDGSSAPSTATWADITSLFTLDANTGSWTFVGSGDGDISAYISSSTYIAFEYIGSSTDGSTWEIDNVLIQEGATVIPTVSLYDIQYTTGSPADSPYMGQEVMTYGIVNGIIQNGPDAGAYFIQDGQGAWNGLYIYDTDAVVAIGDSVELTGTVDEFNGVTELKNISAYTVISSGNALYASESVTSANANNEEWEGVLITVASGECTNNAEGFGLWSINDGSGVIKGDDDIFAYHTTAVIGNWYMVTGIGHYSFGEAKILPRDITDITTTAYVGIETTENNWSIYPNPANGIVTINVNPNALVEIYSMTGAVVYSGVSPKTIDVSGLDAGVYQVVVTENESNTTQKLIVR